MDKESPRPWRVMPMWEQPPPWYKILDSRGNTVVVSVGEKDAKAIVAAVNAKDARPQQT